MVSVGLKIDEPIVTGYHFGMGLSKEGDDSWASEWVEDYLKKVKNGEISAEGPVPEEDGSRKLTYDEAKAILGDNLFGLPELQKTAEFLKEIGIPLTSLLYIPSRIQKGDATFAKDYGEVAFYLPVAIVFGKISFFPSVNNIKAVFERIYGDRSDKVASPPDDGVWYKHETFANGRKGELYSTVFLQTTPFNNDQWRQYQKELEKSDAQCKRLLQPSATEVLLTEMVNYANRQKIFFPSPVSTRTKTNGGASVYLSGFNRGGFVLEKGVSGQALYYPMRVM